MVEYLYYPHVLYFEPLPSYDLKKKYYICDLMIDWIFKRTMTLFKESQKRSTKTESKIVEIALEDRIFDNILAICTMMTRK